MQAYYDGMAAASGDADPLVGGSPPTERKGYLTILNQRGARPQNVTGTRMAALPSGPPAQLCRSFVTSSQ